MSRTNADSFLEEFSPLSEALLPNINAQNANNSTTSFYVTIGTEKCFKLFVSKFFDGIGNIGLSGALDGIRGMETFRNLHSIALITLIRCPQLRKEIISFLEVQTTSRCYGIIAFYQKRMWNNRLKSWMKEI